MEPCPLSWENYPEKKLKILDSALNIFGRHGFHKAKVEDIALAAGVGKGTIYEYFDSKTEILEQTIKYHLDKFSRALVEYADKGATAIEKIRRIVQRHANLLPVQDHLVFVLFKDPGPVGVGLKRWVLEQRAGLLSNIEEIIRQGIREGSIRDVDSRLAASLVFVACHSIIAAHIMPGESRLSPAQATETVMDLLMRGIAARPTGPGPTQ